MNKKNPFQTFTINLLMMSFNIILPFYAHAQRFSSSFSPVNVCMHFSFHPSVIGCILYIISMNKPTTPIGVMIPEAV